MAPFLGPKTLGWILVQKLPQGRKSRIEVLPDRSAVRKTYNDNGAPAEKYRREVGFYIHYSDSNLLPKLIGSRQDESITIERVSGERLADLLPLQSEEINSLADDYTQRLVELFSGSTGIDSKTKQEFYDGLGAEENLALLMEGLDWLSAQYDGHPIVTDLRNSVGKVKSDEELLIKLDWNPENVFLLDGKIHKLIDFEQAFIGTKSILVGILLHNPIWSAERLFRGLKDAGLFETDLSELRNYLCYGFATVLLDSIRRRGRTWESKRLVTAFERHVTTRHSEVAKAF